MIYLTETHQIGKKDSNWKEIDDICFLSKNLYNASLYHVRQYFFTFNTLLDSKGFVFSKAGLYDNLKKCPDFRNGMATRPMKAVFKQVEDMFKSYLAALKSYKTNPNIFGGKPKLPRYKDKVSGRNVTSFNHEALSFKRKGYIHLSKTNIYVKSNKTKSEVKEVRLVPTNLGHYVIEVVTKQVLPKPIISNNFLGIDLGINNLLALASNNQNIPSAVVNGRQVKYINSYYHKLVSKLKSELPKNVFTSKRIKRATKKRNNKIKDLLHKVSKMIILFCKEHDISEIVIGKNKGWKDKVNLGKRNNQNFVSIPFDMLISMLDYKGLLYGVNVTVREESYTSKCSFLDMEDIKKHDSYLGKRIKRGLFVSASGIEINADINGCLNILRKEKGNEIFESNSNKSDPLRVFAVSPVKNNIPVMGKLSLAK